MKTALLFRSYGPYHLARLNAARQHQAILALEYSDIDTEYAWDVKAEKHAAGVVDLSTPMRSGASGRSGFAKRLALELNQFGASAVAIPGYSETFALTALRVSRSLKIPTILMSDTHEGSARRNPFRDLVKKKLVSLYDAALVAGSRHVEYLTHLGFPIETITTGYDIVDNRHFCPSLAWSSNRLPDLPPYYFFCCARFIEKKNLPFLIEAFVRYRRTARADGWDLVIAGDGPLRDTLERQRSASPFAPNIHLIGRKAYDELPAYYGSADAFVFPSLVDEWGLVVNEAMAAGLPILISKEAGCSPDLVVHGVNGFVFDPTDVDELAIQMTRMSTSTRRREMKNASLRIIAGWDLSRFAAGLTEAADIAQQTARWRRDHLGAALATLLSHHI